MSYQIHQEFLEGVERDMDRAIIDLEWITGLVVDGYAKIDEYDKARKRVMDIVYMLALLNLCIENGTTKFS
jgi:hypothetical protein